MNRERLEEQLAELPLYLYDFLRAYSLDLPARVPHVRQDLGLPAGGGQRGKLP